MLRFNGSMWERIRAHAGEDILGISLIEDSPVGIGYLVAQSLGGSASIDHGNLADAMILQYVEN